MAKKFNVTGSCRPAKHYMVNIDSRLEAIKEMVDREEYFAINRAHQYGKTTTLSLLKKKLSSQYAVFSISFEGIEKEAYAAAAPFCQRICRLFYNALSYGTVAGIPETIKEKLAQLWQQEINMADLSDFISYLCSQSDRRTVLIIDEADQAGSQEIFLTFLGMLRNKYLNREEEPVFQSVILAGVYDIKNMKLKIRPETEHQYNSPWNIAADFNIDMSFSAADISGMLAEYEHDHGTGMNVSEMASMLYDYTGGYPYFVSRLCKLMDETVFQNEEPDRAQAWTKQGLLEAVKELMAESNALFDDMVKKLNDFPELKKMLSAILFRGEKVPYSPDVHAVQIGEMFGFLKNSQKTAAVSNRIFETRLYDLFLSEEILESRVYRSALLDRDQFVRDGQLDMVRVLERFTESFHDIYADAEETFIEENGRRFFLLYLKPIINGVGNYYIEARTRNMRRTDIIIDYRGVQYVCELKIWRGNEYHKRGEQQLAGYLDDHHLTIGYMVSFSFNKHKQTGVKMIQADGKTIVEAVV